MSFQSDAFQDDAFDIDDGVPGGVRRRRRNHDNEDLGVIIKAALQLIISGETEIKDIRV